MCLECCFPYRSLIIEEAPKKAEKKEEPKKQWFMIEPGDTMYPAAFYQYGFVEPNRRTADPPNIPSEPILYQYIPAGQRPADPPAPTPLRNDAPAPATIHMTQQIYTTGAIVLPPYPISLKLIPFYMSFLWP
ncbi:hypothetical protein CISG_03475 [Coccidioides immitis RMSCC 3703]|uniref:Uncharacterized protein n=1 Tax=Coccidioides immitis RMSCC 3703 TaxID=454286 RepID=A0A0J8QLE4_COCIT|nr:hypothetical protein CISG_03475 [Coccidioides immitis RMSCC 3703]